MHNLKKLLHIVLGLSMITLGVAGLVLPVLNGTLFLLLGLILLSFESTYIEKHLHALARKNKRIDTGYEKLLTFMKKLFGIHP